MPVQYDSLREKSWIQSVVIDASYLLLIDRRLLVVSPMSAYPITQPSSLFRTAGCTKPFTSIAVHQLMRSLLRLMAKGIS